jgi:hypothetical protein
MNKPVKDDNPFFKRGGLSVVFNLNGNLILASVDSTAKLIDVKSGKIILNLKHNDYVLYSIFNPDESKIATISDHGISIWDIKKGELFYKIDNNKRIDFIKFSPNGKYLMTIDEVYKLKIWDVDAKKIIFEKNNVYCENSDSYDLIRKEYICNQLMNFTRDNENFTFLTYDTLKNNDPSDYLSVSTKKYFISTFNKVNIKSRVIIKQYKLNNYKFISANYDEKNNQIIGIAYNEIVNLFLIQRVSLSSGDLINTTQLKKISSEDTYFNDGSDHTGGGPSQSNQFAKILFNKSKSKLISFPNSGNNFYPNFIRIWNMQTGVELNFLKANREGDYPSYVELSPNENKILTISQVEAKLWDMQTGNQLYTFKNLDSSYFWTGHFSNDGTKIVTIARAIRIWDVATGEEIQRDK